ncbi:MAG: hypothetical protein IJQ67_04135 [Bacilli bacterium]|nr:hypothetical protein [Bacilli bacterium]
MVKKLFLLISSALLFSSVLTSCNFGSLVPTDTKKYSFTYHDLGKRSAGATHYGNSIGEGKILVIPVTIKGYEENATEANREKIRKAFFGSSEQTGWESVSSYFYKSSYGKLNISGEVTPWFDTNIEKDDLINYNSKYDDLGTYYILERAYAWARSRGIDMRDYDVDNDGWIDSIWLIYSCPHNQTSSSSSPYWAFTYWDYNYSIDSPSPTAANPIPNTYAWASVDFMDEGKLAGIDIDAHTYIHEHGHVLGLEDYYDYDKRHSPMGGIDMQDWNIGDHNAFSKFAWGWVLPKSVTESCDITITPTSQSGDCIVVGNNWKGGAFDEYLMIDFIDQENLWKQDSTKMYSSLLAYTEPGIRIMHVDARIGRVSTQSDDIVEVTNYIDNHYRYKLAYSNTPSTSLTTGKYNSKTGRYTFDDLICMVNKNHDLSTTYRGAATASNDCLFKQGDVFDMKVYSDFINDGILHSGAIIPFRITITSLTKDQATLRFTKI